MPQLLQANEITLGDLQKKFQLRRSQNNEFFTEWFDQLPVLTDSEEQALDRIQQNFLNQLESRLMIEETVKLVVIAPLLDLAGFYQHPFRIDTEVSVELKVPGDHDEIIQGRLYPLIVQEQLWILVVESKRTQLSLHTGIPQVLASMLASPNRDRPSFGLITNGSEFTFTKVVQQPTPEFDVSTLFSILNRGNDLYEVLRILKRIGNLIQ
ncbi:MAG: restriction endonuclease subunit R [Oscillatoriales cyanobacterium C42_A2020_001]|nr:restriction endonuclease subunit R [Leptolyngbyaceae cyanobacterium C42_A2020_001]